MRNPQNADRPIRRRRFLILCVSGWCALRAQPASAPAAATPLEAYVRELESSYREVRTLRAEFTQTYVWGGRRRVESDTVCLARGGLMRWDYREPNQKLFISDGKKLFLYIPEEKQLTRSSVKSSEDVRVPFHLLLSRLNLRKVFSRIEFADQALESAPAHRLLRAFPRRGYDEDYREVLIEVGATFDIRRLVVFFPDHSTMEFRFERTERNVTLSPALFRFTPPPGTEVIERP